MSTAPNTPKPPLENAEHSALDVQKLIEELNRKVQEAQQAEADKSSTDKNK